MGYEKISGCVGDMSTDPFIVVLATNGETVLVPNIKNSSTGSIPFSILNPAMILCEMPR